MIRGYSVWNSVDTLGSRVLGVLDYTYHLFMVAYLSFRATLFEHNQGSQTILKVILTQIYFTGWQALPLISVLALAAGSVVILQSSAQLTLLGSGEMIGQLMVVVIVRELSPLITALIVIARSGTAIASELGNMKVNREIEALEIMGVNPLSFIVFPRIVGGVVSLICLAFCFNLVALVGGFLVTQVIHGMDLRFYLSTIVKSFSQVDLLLFVLKNLFGGAAIFVVCCYQGLSVEKGPYEVPQVTTKAVLNSIVYVVAFNLIVTVLVYLNQLIRFGILR